MASEERLRELFGPACYTEGPLSTSGTTGMRFHNVDLTRPLTPAQAAFVLDALGEYRVISFPGQDLDGGRFLIAHLERFANHFGAPCPHPDNYLRNGVPTLESTRGDCHGPGVELQPLSMRIITKVGRAFPGKLEGLRHETPIVNVVNNIVGGGEGKEPTAGGFDGFWHSDIEYEPVPLNASLILVQTMPTRRDPGSQTWVPPKQTPPTKFDLNRPWDRSSSYIAPAFDGSDPELYALRANLPLNGETPFADTAAAFAALPPEEQKMLEGLRVRRRLNEGDEGWLVNLVVANPRTGVKALHSPIWASRPQVRPAIEVEGMSPSASRALLDRLEKHVLQPRFRYDHVHARGDVTVWCNFATVHSGPPQQRGIGSLEDARLFYRISVKGPQSLTLPRNDDTAWIQANVVPPYTTAPEVINMKC